MKNSSKKLFRYYDDMPASFRKGKYVFCYGMLSVTLIAFAVFYVWINFNSILMAFQRNLGGGKTEYTFDNFRQIITYLKMPDSDLHIGLINTLKYFVVGMFISLPLAYLFSYFLFKKVSGYKFFRVIFMFPSIVSAVVYVAVYINVLTFDGPVYVLIKNLFGKELPSLLTNNSTATPTIIIYTVWTSFGVSIILFQSAMSRLPREVIESGQLDGISWWRELLQIVTPMIWPTIYTMIVLQISGIFSSGGPILLFETNGGNRTMTISYFIFRSVYENAGTEFPAAVGVFFTLFSFPLVVAVRYFLGKVDPGVEY